MYVNIPLNCAECNKDFILTAGEHEYRVSLGNREMPEKCPSCCGIKDVTFVEREIACEQCGAKAKVFFEQSPARSVLCFDCKNKE